MTDQVTTPEGFDNSVDVVAMKFSFRKDELGNVRAPIEVNLPVPSVEGIGAIYNAGGKGLEAFVSLVRNAVADHVRSIVNDDKNITSANFPYAKATWEEYVNTPESEKRGRGIAKEVWEEFGKDYISQMPGFTGKSIEAVTLACKLLLNKFQQIKTDKPVIAKLQDQLNMYLQTPNAEQFSECVKFLQEKAETLQKADDSSLLDNL